MSNKQNDEWLEQGNNLEDAPDVDSSEDYPLGGMWEEKDIQDEKELLQDRSIEDIKRLSNVAGIIGDYTKGLSTEREAVRLIRNEVKFWDNEDMGKNYDGFGNFLKKPLSKLIEEIK
jgi:hypothetical protein